VTRGPCHVTAHTPHPPTHTQQPHATHKGIEAQTIHASHAPHDTDSEEARRLKRYARAEVVRGDLLDPVSLEMALQGCTACISCTYVRGYVLRTYLRITYYVRTYVRICVSHTYVLT
jgi:hypothetical protein